MKKIKWEYLSFRKMYKAEIGGVVLTCMASWSSTYAGKDRSKWQWHCGASIGNGYQMRRTGPTRKTLARSKEDAIKLASELLEDCRSGLDNITNLFDVAVR